MRVWWMLGLLMVSLAAQAVPQRIVALSWDAAEQVLALGVTPLAVADRADYQRWVARPALPPSVQDAGSRLEPNLELLARLKPDLILIDGALADLQPRLAHLGPVLSLQAFSVDHDNAAMARQIYLQLATVLGRTAYAQQQLRRQQTQLAQWRVRLAARYPAGAPAVCVIRVGSPSAVWLYGRNSMPQAAIQALGLRPGCPVETGAWGVAQRRVSDLARLSGTAVLAIAPLAPGGALWHSPLWQAMPFVREGRFAAMRPSWTYGGVFSLLYLAEGVVQGLETMGG
ncbi:ABC transporter substrate-binding protein [Paludibacterium sp. B53371]|uniref:ABC transporter substrate-binding protein n=1 Tax=Paludibacterium sp. B53371 TaxID=2806263 RepID=UPI001C05A4A2|nr:ABC transporter substrate-binding protein [Paludibacterium sp. B53371]